MLILRCGRDPPAPKAQLRVVTPRLRGAPALWVQGRVGPRTPGQRWASVTAEGASPGWAHGLSPALLSFAASAPAPRAVFSQRCCLLAFQSRSLRCVALGWPWARLCLSPVLHPQCPGERLAYSRCSISTRWPCLLDQVRTLSGLALRSSKCLQGSIFVDTRIWHLRRVNSEISFFALMEHAATLRRLERGAVCVRGFFCGLCLR